MDRGSRQRQGIHLTMRPRCPAPLLLHALLPVMGLFAAATANAAESRTVQRQISADPRGEVSLNSVAGSIDVSGWDKPQVAVTADLQGENLGLEVSSEGGQTRVRITGYGYGRSNIGPGLFNFPGRSRDGRQARLTVRVPRQSRLNVTAVSAAIHSSGVLGEQRLQSVSGDIRAELAAADAQVRTVSGNMVLSGNGEDAQLKASSVSGDVTLSHGAGDLQVTTISGYVRAALAPARGVRLRTTSGDISLSATLARGASVQVDTLGGHVDIHAPAQYGFAYDVSSFTGDIDDCFGQRPVHSSEYGPGMHMAGTRGAGDGSVHIRTLSGGVSLCDR